ncbi:unnamed protein product [Rotaria sordida]|uniref:Uncharacterized protein n=1 Tax=Rotaria sordida TaxID=392033 RepID=A0A818T875_9BILA|nr:unnamed protein product [Rotaria sordida]CAF3680114.1 unnamed protein product [Rotaria sordida]
MRLKTLRKERPTFEIEGAVVNGSRMDISNSDIKAIRHRSNTSFAFPTSLNTESSTLTVSPLDYADEMNNHSREQIVIPTISQPSNISPYQAIEAAYLEHGIRIRLSPTRMTPSGQQSERKSANSFQRRPAFISRHPSRTSSVLHYSTINQDQYNDSRSFSALQQMSSNDFDQTREHNRSYAQSSQIKEETYEDYYSSSIKTNEHSNFVNSPEIFSMTNGIASSTRLCDHDSDLMYMSSLMNQPNGESVRETIRRRAGLRGTFAVHRNPLAANPVQSQQPSREKSPIINRTSLTRNTTISVVPTSSPHKIDNDILKHASRIRRTSVSKDYSIKSPRTNTTSTASSPLRTNAFSTFTTPPRINTVSNASSSLRTSTISSANSLSRANTISSANLLSKANTILIAGSSSLRTTNNNYSYKRNSTDKSLKSISLEPLEVLLTSTPHSTPLSMYDPLPIKVSSITRNPKTSTKRTKSAVIPTVKNSQTANVTLKEHSTSSSILRDESLSLMKTSTTDVIHQSNSIDSGCYDRSSSGGDLQSFTSSSMVRVPSSIPSGRLTSSAVRRSNSNKKVSFYEEPTAVILTTATYV